MRTIKEVKLDLLPALDAARAASVKGTRDEEQAASRVVEALQKELSDVITAGAKPCPRCKNMPHGMEHPTGKGGIEYEVGCIAGCPPFAHDDGTLRIPRVRGGRMPLHAVEAWNGGPDFWDQALNGSKLSVS